jgi:3-ketosteroid 9alpha-monooxygenase subunit B
MPPDREYHRLAVVDVVEETADCRSFVLDIPDELAPLFVYAAGQYCMFRAAIDGDSVVRAYSMSSSPDAGDRFTTTVKRVPGGRMSNWMNDTLVVGDTIDVMRPTGLFVLRDTDVPMVAFAGGSGITPVISIIKSALATTRRPILLVYANRGADSIIFADELERLRSAYGDRLTLLHHVDAERGFLDPAQCAALVAEHTHADFYICGPGAYMDTVEAGLATHAVAPTQLFIERFGLPTAESAPAVALEAAPVAGEGTVPETLVIRLDRKKHTVAYTAGDTLLQAARRGGLRPPFSCEAGNCATCMAHLDQGSVTMRVNNALSADELAEGWILTCQSIPTSREIAFDYGA